MKMPYLKNLSKVFDRLWLFAPNRSGEILNNAELRDALADCVGVNLFLIRQKKI